jgi:hypothetical protein
MSRNDWPEETNDPRDSRGSSGDAWDGNRDPYAPPPRTGMSSGVKFVLIVLAIIGACCVLCCGVVGYFGYSMKPQTSKDPATINAARDRIAKINLPAEFKPEQLVEMNMVVATLSTVRYSNPAIHGEFVLGEFNMKFGGDQQAKAEFRRRIDQQEMGKDRELKNAKTETKSLKIKGQEYPFDFSVGDDPATGKKRRLVTGTYQGDHGFVFLSLAMDDSAYKQDQVVKMIESIQ